MLGSFAWRRKPLGTCPGGMPDACGNGVQRQRVPPALQRRRRQESRPGHHSGERIEIRFNLAEVCDGRRAVILPPLFGDVPDRRLDVGSAGYLPHVPRRGRDSSFRPAAGTCATLLPGVLRLVRSDARHGRATGALPALQHRRGGAGAERFVSFRGTRRPVSRQWLSRQWTSRRKPVSGRRALRRRLLSRRAGVPTADGIAAEPAARLRSFRAAGVSTFECAAATDSSYSAVAERIYSRAACLLHAADRISAE